MKNIKIIYLSLIAGISILWLLASDFSTFRPTMFSIRGFAIDYTGFLSFAVMSVAMILAVRPKIIEPWLNGLDKGYRLHKWLGITALVTSVTHWLSAMGPKWAMSLGLLETGARPKRPPSADGQEVDVLANWLRSQRGLAESIGEWAFYIAIALIVMALVKRIAYNKSFNLHRVFSIVYLGLVFHAIILVKTTYWLQPIGMITALLMVGGTISAIISLVGAIGKSNKHDVTVKNISHFNHSDVIKIDVSIEDKWPGHRAGQFAFVQFTDTKENHPFTISSTWKNDGDLSFIIKALGDHTSSIVNTIELGQSLTVEGPYGQFDFESQRNQQVWVAGGIGITPFIARMKYLSLTKEFSQPVTLFYCVKSSDSKMIEYVKSCATAANVHLEVLVEDNNQLLDLGTIKSHVSDWQSSDYWFCGPTQFGKALKSSLTDAGVDGTAFHQELFEMR